MEKTKCYKYCIVPKCVSSTINTPGKIFFFIPRGVDVRKKWCLAMKRDEKKNGKLSGTSTLHCCEDHFKIPEDTENYLRYKLTGKSVTLRLRKNVLPHIFECQKVQTSKHVVGRRSSVKRKVQQIVEEAVQVEKMFIKTEYSDDDKFMESEEEDCLLRGSGKVKCEDEQNGSSTAPFPIKQEYEDSSTSALKEDIDIEDHKPCMRSSHVGIFKGGPDRCESGQESGARRQAGSTESKSG